MLWFYIKIHCCAVGKNLSLILISLLVLKAPVTSFWLEERLENNVFKMFQERSGYERYHFVGFINKGKKVVN